MTETPPPRRALATFLRRPAPGAASPATPEAPGPAAVDTPAAAPAASAATDGLADPPVQAPLPADVLPAPEATEPPAQAGHDVPLIPLAASDAVSPRAPDIERPEAAQPVEPATDWHAAALPVAAPHAPTFARPRAKLPAPRAPAWQWFALCVLAVLLVVQVLLADRARLATDASWRPLLATLCGALRCELPVWHEPAAFTMLDRDVRPAADQPGVLRIQASFRNDARWEQAWPYVQLSLSDADGRVIGSRVFAPADYLGHAPPAGETLAPGQSGRIDFRVREPAAGTSAFTFDFH